MSPAPLAGERHDWAHRLESSWTSGNGRLR